MISKEEVFNYIKTKYGKHPEYLWTRTPNYAIFRHSENRKWFAAVIDITEDKLGIESKKIIDAILLKCGPQLSGSLKDGTTIFPGWHMNKELWITVHLGNSIDKQKIFGLIDLSFELTKSV